MYFKIYWADLNPTVGREQSGHRLVLVISNNIENQMDIVSVIPITSRKKGRVIYPNELKILLLEKEAILLMHQIRTISKKRLGKNIASINDQQTQKKVLDILCMRFDTF